MSLLDVFCVFDWITPLVSLLDNDSVTIAFHSDQTGAVCDALDRAGIRYKRPGGTIDGSMLMLDIAKKDEDKARRVLRRHGIK